MVMEESMTWEDQEPQTPAEYFQLGRLCLKAATTATIKDKMFPRWICNLENHRISFTPRSGSCIGRR